MRIVDTPRAIKAQVHVQGNRNIADPATTSTLDIEQKENYARFEKINSSGDPDGCGVHPVPASGGESNVKGR
jgi:hypothetical protein